MRRGRSGDGDRLDGAVPVDPSESKDCGRGAQSNYSTTLTPPLGSVPWVTLFAPVFGHCHSGDPLEEAEGICSRAESAAFADLADRLCR